MTEIGPFQNNDESSTPPQPDITIRTVHVMPGSTIRNLLGGMGVEGSDVEMLHGSLDDTVSGEPYQLTDEQTDQLLRIEAEADAGKK